MQVKYYNDDYYKDFSENYKNKQQNEIQSAYFGQSCVRVFTVCFYLTHYSPMLLIYIPWKEFWKLCLWENNWTYKTILKKEKNIRYSTLQTSEKLFKSIESTNPLFVSTRKKFLALNFSGLLKMENRFVRNITEGMEILQFAATVKKILMKIIMVYVRRNKRSFGVASMSFERNVVSRMMFSWWGLKHVKNRNMYNLQSRLFLFILQVCFILTWFF